MNVIDLNMKFNQSHFEILRKIGKTAEHTQRKLANTLGFSLGKLNYCLKSLKQKGLVKINNFKKSKKKIKYVYKLTPSGVSEKTKLTVQFMQRKMKEYDELKKELEENK
jgi:EPS-associated MarR family transcriptional regulator